MEFFFFSAFMTADFPKYWLDLNDRDREGRFKWGIGRGVALVRFTRFYVTDSEISVDIGEIYGHLTRGTDGQVDRPDNEDTRWRDGHNTVSARSNSMKSRIHIPIRRTVRSV